MKFTPGPWKIQNGSMSTAVVSKTKYVARIYRYVPVIGDEDAANAKLIAAAPTMYKYIKDEADNGCVEAIAIINSINND